MNRTHLFAVQAYEGTYIPFKGKFFIKVLWNYKSEIETYDKSDGYQSEATARNAGIKLATKFNGAFVSMEDMQAVLEPIVEEPVVVETPEVESVQRADTTTSRTPHDLTLSEALQHSTVAYKRDGDGYIVASKANFSAGYFLDFKSFDPTKQSSVSTSMHYVSLEEIAQHTAKGWQLNKPTRTQEADTTASQPFISIACENDTHTDCTGFVAPEMACECPCHDAQSASENIATFFMALDTFSQTQPLYVAQPHEYVYGSPMRPMSSVWARVPDAHYEPSNVAKTGMHSLVIVPHALPTETVSKYELVLIARPQKTICEQCGGSLCENEHCHNLSCPDGISDYHFSTTPRQEQEQLQHTAHDVEGDNDPDNEQRAEYLYNEGMQDAASHYPDAQRDHSKLLAFAESAVRELVDDPTDKDVDDFVQGYEMQVQLLDRREVLVAVDTTTIQDSMPLQQQEGLQHMQQELPAWARDEQASLPLQHQAQQQQMQGDEPSIIEVEMETLGDAEEGEEEPECEECSASAYWHIEVIKQGIKAHEHHYTCSRHIKKYNDLYDEVYHNQLDEDTTIYNQEIERGLHNR